MQLNKLWIALLVLMAFAGCNRFGWINDANRQFQQQKTYISVYYFSKYRVITYQAVSPKLCAMLTYHAMPDALVPFMAGIRIQDLNSGKERNVFLGLNRSQSGVAPISAAAQTQIKEYFTANELTESKFDCRAISLHPSKMVVKKTVKGARLVLEGETQNLQLDKCFAPLLPGEHSCFKIVLDSQTSLPINEYYWSADASIVRYLIFVPDIGPEVQRIRALNSLAKVQTFLEKRRVFERMRFDLTEK